MVFTDSIKAAEQLVQLRENIDIVSEYADSCLLLTSAGKILLKALFGILKTSEKNNRILVLATGGCGQWSCLLLNYHQ